MTGGGEKAASDFKVPFLGAIPIDIQIVKSTDQGKPFICSNNENETSQAFEKIVQSIMSKIEL
jgi:septum formation inhibitor-activating ATPase MinD